MTTLWQPGSPAANGDKQENDEASGPRRRAGKSGRAARGTGYRVSA